MHTSDILIYYISTMQFLKFNDNLKDKFWSLPMLLLEMMFPFLLKSYRPYYYYNFPTIAAVVPTTAPVVDHAVRKAFVNIFQIKVYGNQKKSMPSKLITDVV